MIGRRRLAAAAGAFLLAIGSTAPASAESVLWTVTATPLTAPVGTPKTFNLTATNEDPLATLTSSSRIGCVQIDVPANFIVTGAQVSGSNSGTSWTANVSGNRVRVQAGSGGDRLRLLGWVSFAIHATPTSTGSLTWVSRAFERVDCGGTGALLGVPPIVVVTNPPPTPTPVPTPVPTARPTPSPTPRPTATPSPTPLVPLPSVLPSLPVFGTPSPSATARPTDDTGPERPTPTPTPEPGGGGGASGEPLPTGRPSSSPGAGDGENDSGASPDGGTGGPSGGGSGAPVVPAAIVSGPTVVLEPATLELGGAGIGLLSGIDVWVVPGAAIGGPGLLILLWIALQTAGTFAWLPAVRRLRGSEERGRS